MRLDTYVYRKRLRNIFHLFIILNLCLCKKFDLNVISLKV